MKEFLMRKMLERQLQGVPEEQKEKLIRAFSKNPELLQKIAQEMQEEMKNGKGQQEAALSVFRAHEEELRTLLE